MNKPTYTGMSEDMKRAFRELIFQLMDEGWTSTRITDMLARYIDPTTEFFTELTKLIMDASTI